jgi:hypothetical protein
MTMQPLKVDKWSIYEVEPGNLMLKSLSLGCFNKRKLAAPVDSIRNGIFFFHIYNIEARLKGNTFFRKIWKLENYMIINDTLIQIYNTSLND